MKKIRLAVIGTGGMANWHVENFKKVDGVEIIAGADIKEENRKKFGERHGIDSGHMYEDFKKMLDCEKPDAVTNVTTDAVHCPVALEVIRRGIPLLSEKPLAKDLAEARKMYAAVKKAKIINMVNFSYRSSAGLQEAARLVREGKIGRIIHVESSYLQSWLSTKVWGDWHTNPAWLWRLSKKHGSQGVLGDIGCHIYDLTTLLCGDDITEMYCHLKTFKKDVAAQRVGEYVLDANDSFVTSFTLKGGAIGTVHSSRWATGHKNSLRCRVYGDKGAIEVDLDRSYGEYRICVGKNADKSEWETVTAKPFPNNYARFIAAIRTGKNDASDFLNGLKIQAYLHYSFESDKKGRPVKVKI